MTKKEIFTTYRMDIFRTCYYMVKDYHDAEDLCQDVFIKAFQEDINKIEKVKPWLIRIAMNTSRNYLKRKSRITLKEDFLNFIFIPKSLLADWRTNIKTRKFHRFPFRKSNYHSSSRNL